MNGRAPHHPARLIAALIAAEVPHAAIAAALGRDRSVASKLLSGTRAMKATEIEPLRQVLISHLYVQRDGLLPRGALRRLIRELVVEELDARSRRNTDLLVRAAQVRPRPGDGLERRGD